MMENWQSQDDLADPDWRAERDEGHLIGLAVVLGLAVVMAIVCRYAGVSETLIANPFVPEWPV